MLGATEFSARHSAGESPADFRVDGNEIIGQPIDHNPKNAFLCSPVDYRDFELRFDFRIRPGPLNSGVQFRSETKEGGIVAGPQLELDVQDPDDMSFFHRHLADRLVPLAQWAVFSEPGLDAYAAGLSTQAALQRALDSGCEVAMVTRGEQPVWWCRRGGTLQRMPVPRVKAVDTTGAGDVFHAALALALGEGRAERDAVAFAATAAALKCLGGPGVLGAPRIPETRTRSGPSWARRIEVKSAETSGVRYAFGSPIS